MVPRRSGPSYCVASRASAVEKRVDFRQGLL